MPPVADKTYSFKAPITWGPRLDRARETLRNLGDELEGPYGERILHEFELALFRRAHTLSQMDSQSELLRLSVELLVAATEKVERDRRLGDEYEAAGRERTEDERAFARASASAAARRWRDK